jgi:glycosyltransferase involved in cell wall biosynthesis
LAGLWRYGYQDEERLFRETIEEEGLSDRIVVTGRLSEEELEDYYSRAMIFLRLGIDEIGVGGGCLDALSWGIPIVTNKALGISEVLVDGVNGRVFDDIDPIAIARGIDELIGDNMTYRNVSDAASATAREYLWQRHATLLKASLAEAIVSRCPSCDASHGILTSRGQRRT